LIQGNKLLGGSDVQLCEEFFLGSYCNIFIKYFT
jgi:hypothetical protein